MVKINDNQGGAYLSTTLRNPVTNTPQVKAEGREAVQASQQLTNNLVQKANQERQEAAQSAARAKEIQFQGENTLKNLDIKLQETALSTMTNLALMDEKNRQARENDVANSYILKQTSELALKAQVFNQENRKNAGRYGEGLFENTQNWVNSQLTELEKNAPNELARVKLQSYAADFKVKQIGNAIQEADSMRKEGLVIDVQETIEMAAKQAYADTTQFDLDTTISRTSAVLAAAGIDKNKVVKINQANAEKIILARMDGLLDTGNFKQIKEDISKLGGDISIDSLLKVLDKAEKLEQNTINNNYKELLKKNVTDQYLKGEFTGAEHTDFKKAAGEVFINTAIEFEKQMQETGDVSVFVNGITAFLKDKAGAKLTEYKTFFEANLKSKDPLKAIGSAQILKNLMSDIDGSKIIDSISKEDVARAESMLDLTKIMDFDSAMNQTNALMNITPQERSFYDTTYRNAVRGWFGNEKTKSVKDIVEDTDLDTWTSTPDADPTIALDFERLRKQFFTIYKGDIHKAEETASNIIRAQFARSNINSVDGTVTVERYPVESFYPTEKLQTEFKKQVSGYMKQKLGDNLNWEKREIKINDDLVVPFKIVPIRGLTENQKNKEFTSWQIINAKPGYGFEPLMTVNVPTDLFSEQNKKSHSSWLASKAKTLEQSKESYAQLQKGLTEQSNKLKGLVPPTEEENFGNFAKE
jgi:hypothetical protein